MTAPATPTKANGPERTDGAPCPAEQASGGPSRTTNLTPPWDMPSEQEVQEAADRAEARRQAAAAAEPAPPPVLPKNSTEWLPYALAWIAAETDPEDLKTRWSQERKLRNAIGVVQEERLPVEEQMVVRVKYLLTK